MIIGIDFDGTCVTHEFPAVGKDIGAAPVLKDLVAAGHKLILFTMRSDRAAVVSDDPSIHNEAKPYLSEAVKWFADNGIELWGINRNPNQHTWTDSQKPYCHLYIDDAALGAPLWDNHDGTRRFIDWFRVRAYLSREGFLTKESFTKYLEGIANGKR